MNTRRGTFLCAYVQQVQCAANAQRLSFSKNPASTTQPRATCSNHWVQSVYIYCPLPSPISIIIIDTLFQ